MKNNEDSRAILYSLRKVRRMTRKLLRVPVDCLRVDGDDIADGLGIVLRRVCGRPDVSMPPFEAGAAHAVQFRWFIQKAARQAGAIRRDIFFGQVSKARLAEEAWAGLDSAEAFLHSFLSETVHRERRRLR